MKFHEKIGYIISETFNSPGKDSVVVEVKGIPVVLREGGNYQGINLEGVDLRGANLDGIILEDANLANSNLTGVHLRNANLLGANLNRVVISGGDMTGIKIDEGALKKAVVVDAFPLGISSKDITES